MVDKRKPQSYRRIAGRSILEALLPMQAWRSLKQAKDSLVRTGTMLRTGKPSDDYEPSQREIDQAVVNEVLIEEGKKIVLSLGPKERFHEMYTALEWSDEDLSKQMRAMRRAHTIRLCALYLATLLLPSLVIRYGWLPTMYDVSLIGFLIARCLKSYCLYTQLRERALWEFKDMKDREGLLSLMKRSLWFLD